MENQPSSKSERGFPCTLSKCIRTFIVVVILGIGMFTVEFFASSTNRSAQTIPKFFREVVAKTSKALQPATIKQRPPSPVKITPTTVKTTPILSASRPSMVIRTNQTMKDFRETHFMTVSGNGRLGNQMFEFASLIGTACRHNYTPFISSRNRLHLVFELNVPRDINLINSASIGESKSNTYNKKLEYLDHSKNWTLNGYFQSWRYFDHCKADVLKSFKFKPNIKRKATEVLKTINAKGRPLVFVHIRRGDMAVARELKRGYNVATPEYLTKALAHFRRVLKSPMFLVISDDQNWSKTYVNGKDVVYAGTRNAEVDMAIMSLCNHAIITSGTFGWWGAYLTGGITVYFRGFPAPGSWLAGQFNLSDYYPPDWIGME